jgi:hypothetical protein
MASKYPWAERLLPTLVSMNEQYRAVVRDFTDEALREGELSNLLSLLGQVERRAQSGGGQARIVYSFAVLGLGERIEQALREEGGSGEQVVE